MKYIVETIVELIINNAPAKDTEMMIRIDSFEDIKIYESISRKITEKLNNNGLSVKIKLAKTKCKQFKSNAENLTYIQAMEQKNWVADAESITHYRNMHNTNVLILMGTESEEDKGGLLNCYTITPNTLIDYLSGDYFDVFTNSLDFTKNEIDAVNKLYKDLFAFVAIDICKLSDLFDSWNNRITTIDDFIELFYGSLPLWGLPYKKMKLPTFGELKTKNNILRLEHNFISRQLFKNISKSKYEKYKTQIEAYEKEDGEYNSLWEGWSSQSIKSYDEMTSVVLGYARGDKINEYKEKLIDTDFSIIEDILGVKVTKEKKERSTIPVVLGEPLEAFSSALLRVLMNIKTIGVEISNIEFDISQAEIVSMYSDVEDEEEKQQLQNTWLTICRYANGVFDYLNRNKWYVNDEKVNITCNPENIFSPQSTHINIDFGYVKAAGANKTLNKIDFSVKCKDKTGDVVKFGNKRMIWSFQWRFKNIESWLHSFSDICMIDEFINSDNIYIPVAEIKKITQFLFAKSEEEFFDLYDESDIKFNFNLAKYVDENTIESNKFLSAKFNNLGKKFVKFINAVSLEGFYSVICKEQSILIELLDAYTELGDRLTEISLSENQRWILDAYIRAFNIEGNVKVISNDNYSECCIVPVWHPATLEKMNNQKTFFLDGCAEWWNEINTNGTKYNKSIDALIENLTQMSMIQSSLDIFPSYNQQYYGVANSFGNFSVYGRSDIENNNRLKDMIHKDAIYDDDFDTKANKRMNDNAKMLYGVLEDYRKAFPKSYRNLSIIFIDPSELQPIIAAIYKYVEVIRKNYPEDVVNINIKILVKPKNKGGSNYLAYWMDESFSQDSNVNIKVYLNEWKTKTDIDKILNGNNDIVFVMDILRINNLQFIKESESTNLDLNQCKFPIVYKPSPVSNTSCDFKRKIELSQPQFRCSFAHTQVTRYRNNSETIPNEKYIAIREVIIDDEIQSIVYNLHKKAYWVVCIDSGMDGALLRKSEQKYDEYSIIGFSTGKGAYGQYNLTITARKPIIKTIQKKLESRLYQLFHWEKDKIIKAANMCIKEASSLDGISLLSAINQRDHNINEFMAYVLTSLIEKDNNVDSALKIVIHLDSYKHWFGDEVEKDEESHSRPDFLVFEVNISDDDKLKIKAIVTECKMSSIKYSDIHKEKAVEQVIHGIKRLSTIFDANSTSIKRRYWYAQLYGALAFAQVTFSDNSNEFIKLSSRLRSVLEGNFEIEWTGKVLGYWLDMGGETEDVKESYMPNIKLYDFPQKRIQQLLLDESLSIIKFIDIDENELITSENQDKLIEEKEKELQDEVKNINKITYNLEAFSNSDKLEIENVNNLFAQESTLAYKINYSETNYNLNAFVEDINLQNEEASVSIEPKKEDILVFEDTNVSENEKVSNLEDMRVLIGTDKFKEPVYWEFGNKQLSNRHLLITGTSGQGKTYSIQTMLYELSKSNVSSVIFDYTEGFRIDQLEKEFVDKIENYINSTFVKFEGVPINPFKRQFIEYEKKQYPEKDVDIASRFANIITHVYSFGQQQLSAVFEAVMNGLEKYKDKMNMNYFKKELELARTHNKVADSVYKKMTPFFYGIEFKENGDFNWENIIYPSSSTATIFQLTAIDRDMQVIVTELMLWDLWYYSTKYGKKDKPFVVVLDEAQNLSHKDKSPSCKILTEGRKFGWSAWYATQSLQVLSDDEVTRLLQSAFKLYFKPTDSEIVKMAKQIDPADGQAWLNSVKGLSKGQCIVVGERIRKDGKFGGVKPTITNVTPFNERS